MFINQFFCNIPGHQKQKYTNNIIMNKIIGLVFIFIFMIFLVFAIFKHSNAEKNRINIAIDDIDYVINTKKGRTNFALLKENNKLNILKNEKY